MPNNKCTPCRLLAKLTSVALLGPARAYLAPDMWEPLCPGGFIAVIYLGHVFIWGLVAVLQAVMVSELFKLAQQLRAEKELPGFRCVRCTAASPCPSRALRSLDSTGRNTPEGLG